MKNYRKKGNRNDEKQKKEGTNQEEFKNDEKI